MSRSGGADSATRTPRTRWISTWGRPISKPSRAGWLSILRRSMLAVLLASNPVLPHWAGKLQWPRTTAPSLAEKLDERRLDDPRPRGEGRPVDVFLHLELHDDLGDVDALDLRSQLFQIHLIVRQPVPHQLQPVGPGPRLRPPPEDVVKGSVKVFESGVGKGLCVTVSQGLESGRQCLKSR